MFKKKPKSKKILEIEYPLLASYPHIAGILAMFKNNPYTLPLVLSELSELTYDKEIDRLDFSVALEIEHYMNNYPLVYSHGVSRSFVEMKWNNAISFFKDVINEEYYAIMLVDTYYISAYKDTYGKQHYFHDMMIYGYDEKEEEFYVADCFVNGKYEFTRASFAEIEASFIHTHRNDWINGIRLFKLREEPYVGIGYNADYITEACKRYLNGEKSLTSTYIEGKRRYDLDERFVDGIGIYDELINYIDDDIASTEEWRSYDIRIFYVLYDHMKMFRYMTKQLMQRNQIINAPSIYDNFLDVENRIKNLYMNVLKYNITGSEKAKKDIKEKLLDIKVREEEAIKGLIDNFEEDKEVIKQERKLIVRPDVIEADSIFVEYDEESHWKKKSLNDRTIHTDVPGAYMKTLFFGCGVKINVLKKKSYGQAMIYVDGIEKCTIDYSSDEEIVEEQILNLETGYHWIKIVNVSENGQMINVGRIEVIKQNEETTSECRLLECKRGTGGNLIKDYGNAGYDIVGAKRKLPDYLTETNYTIHNGVTVLLIHNEADWRGVKKSMDSDDRVAAYLLRDTEMWLEITIPGKAREVGFYSVDYDNLGRKMEISVEDADTGNELYSQVVENFSEGIFIQLLMKGHIIVRFKNVEGPDAVLNAVWFE